MPVKATPKSQILDVYDYLIIGAGIGGLVLGNYLIREGHKVLIIEQHYLVGGCCTTFSRGKYYFNAAAHHLSSVGENERFRLILEELGVWENLNMSMFSENDLINYGRRKDKIFLISPLKDKTKNRLIEEFPSYGKHISNFFDYFFSDRFMYDTLVKNVANQTSLYDVMNSFDLPPDVLDIFETVLLGYGTLELKKAHPYAARMIIESQVFTHRGIPGDHKMQTLSDQLANKFISNGGHLLLSEKIIKIENDNQSKLIKGAISDKDEKYLCNFLVANTSPVVIYDLLSNGNDERFNSIKSELDTLPLSKSFFSVYFGNDSQHSLINQKYKNYSGYSDILMLTNNDDSSEIFWNKNIQYTSVSYGKTNSSYSTFCGVNLISRKNFWTDEIKNEVLKKYLKEITHFLDIDYLSENVFMNVATPNTIEKYTLNPYGSSYGFTFYPDSDWAKYMKSKDKIFSNLYYVGHWAGPAGVDQVAVGAKKLFKQLQRIK